MAKKITLAGSKGGIGTARGVVVANGFAYVACADSGVRKIDLSNLGDMSVAASYDVGATWAKGIYTYGERVYVAHDTIGLRVFDLAFNVLGTYDSAGLAQHVFVVDAAHVFLCDNTGGFIALNCTNPASITAYSTLATTAALFVLVENGLAYLADGTGGLKIIDVSNPASMSIRSTSVCGTATGLCKNGNTVYVATDVGIYIYDVTDPVNPIQLNIISPTENFNRVAWGEGLLFVATDGGEFRVYDVSDPLSPTLLIGYTVTASTTHDIHYSDGFVYYADGTAGLKVFKVEDIITRISWVTRRLNHVADGKKNVALASDRFTLPAGTYRFRVSCPACGVGSHQARLQCLTTGQTWLGTSGCSPADHQTQTRSWVFCRVEVKQRSVFHVQHAAQTPVRIFGLGRAGDMQGDAIYTVVEIWPEEPDVTEGSTKTPPPMGFATNQLLWLNEVRNEIVGLSKRSTPSYIRIEDRRDAGVQGGSFG